MTDSHTKKKQENCMSDDACYYAVRYCLDRAQTDPDFGYYAGPGTEAFRLLCVAEADYRGVELGVVEAARRIQYWHTEPEVCRLHSLLTQGRLVPKDEEDSE